MRIEFCRLVSASLTFKPLEHIFRPERQPCKWCPEKVETGNSLVLFLVLRCGVGRIGNIQERNLHVPLGEFHAAEYLFCEFLIDSAAIAPCFRPIKIIEELIEAGDLGRLKGLVCNQCSL